MSARPRAVAPAMGWLAAAALLLALAACRSVSAPPQTLEQVQKQRFAAMVAQDIATLESMLAEELSYTHSNGQMENKPQFLETVRSGSLRYVALESKQLDVRLYGHLALLTGRAHARVQLAGQPMELELRYTDAYAWRDGRWQLVAWQSTRVP